MDLGPKDKVAIITGASRGIGAAIAGTLSAEGMRLVLVARTGSDLKTVASRCGTDTCIVPLDLRQTDTPQKTVDEALATFGGIDLLVNNAGATKRGDFLTLNDDDWQDGFALKFYAAMRCSRAAWKHLQASQGAIINIAGVGGRTGNADFTIGGSVNASLMYLTKALADRGAKDGIRVNAINPGSIATERLQTRIQTAASEQNTSLDEAAGIMARKLGVARFGSPGEIAKAVAFFASPVSAYCQGSILDVDGGQTKTL